MAQNLANRVGNDSAFQISTRRHLEETLQISFYGIFIAEINVELYLLEQTRIPKNIDLKKCKNTQVSPWLNPMRLALRARWLFGFLRSPLWAIRNWAFDRPPRATGAAKGPAPHYFLDLGGVGTEQLAVLRHSARRLHRVQKGT
jgi:hypothetical protein